MLTQITRNRELPFQQGSYTSILRVSGSSQVTKQDASITGKQTTTSESHPEYFRTRRTLNKAGRNNPNLERESSYYKERAGKDNGGPFHTVRHDYWTSHPHVDLYASKGSDSYEYHGPMAAISHSVGAKSTLWPVTSAYDENALRAAGATAISKVAPLNPQVGVATALGELRNDGLPLLPGKELLSSFLKKERILSAASGEFLNIVFGWKPTISELKDLSKVVKNSSELIAQLRRDSGRLIRRRFDFRPVKSETTTVVNSGTSMTTSPSLRPEYWNSMTGVRTKTVSTETYMWFTGCFSYLLDPGDTAMERALYHLRIANALYGVAITPEVLWELTPWSWAIDWFTNIGDVITNLSNWAVSGQTLRWGYLMRTERITHTYTLEGPTLKGGHPGPFIQKFITTDKRRIKASPYGFQLEWNGFSNTQKAILAALGITRSGL